MLNQSEIVPVANNQFVRVQNSPDHLSFVHHCEVMKNGNGVCLYINQHPQVDILIIAIVPDDIFSILN